MLRSRRHPPWLAYNWPSGKLSDGRTKRDDRQSKHHAADHVGDVVCGEFDARPNDCQRDKSQDSKERAAQPRCQIRSQREQAAQEIKSGRNGGMRAGIRSRSFMAYQPIQATRPSEEMLETGRRSPAYERYRDGKE